MRYLLGFVVVMSMAWACSAAQPAQTEPPKDDKYADNACVQCHRDLPGRSYEIVHDEWRQSVHFAAGVACDGCHGGNASLKRDQFDSEDAFRNAAHMQRNPEFLLMYRDKEFVNAARGRSVSYFCGKCHAKIKEQHLGSPHGEFGDPTCLYCHTNSAHGKGSHQIMHPTPQIIDTRSRSENGKCSPCHRSGTMEAVGRIKKLLLTTEEQIKTSGEQYEKLEQWGYRNLELEKLHHHAKEVRSQLRQIFHSFNMREINNFAGEIQGTVERTSATYELVQKLRETQHQQTLVGVCAVLLLLCFAGLLIYYKKSFLEHHAAPAAGKPDGLMPHTASRGREANESGIPMSEKPNSEVLVRQ